MCMELSDGDMLNLFRTLERISSTTEETANQLESMASTMNAHISQLRESLAGFGHRLGSVEQLQHSQNARLAERCPAQSKRLSDFEEHTSAQFQEIMLQFEETKRDVASLKLSRAHVLGLALGCSAMGGCIVSIVVWIVLRHLSGEL